MKTKEACGGCGRLLVIDDEAGTAMHVEPPCALFLRFIELCGGTRLPELVCVADVDAVLAQRAERTH